MIEQEEIIIDGVDVSKCAYLDIETLECNCEHHDTFVKNLKNKCLSAVSCYYKQLQRERGKK